jgi:hypothetical protein
MRTALLGLILGVEDGGRNSTLGEEGVGTYLFYLTSLWDIEIRQSIFVEEIMVFSSG